MSLAATTEIQNAATATAQLQAKTDTVTGAASAKMTSTQFMNLLLKQLQYQDPMSPTDNNQFISQQCQFSQLSATEETNASIDNNNGIAQATSLVGKYVTVTDATDKTKTISGTVTSATINGKDSAISINGVMYPLSSIKNVSNTAPATTTGT